MTTIQKLAWFYSGLFVFVTALGYMPWFINGEGMLFGLFSLQLHDDFLHMGSGIWAAIAAWHSTQSSVNYFKIFGVLYGLDGVIGLITGLGYLDLGIFLHDPVSLDLLTRFAANIPHILIGGVAVYIGFVLSKKFSNLSTI